MIIYNDKGIKLLNVDVDDASYAYSELCGNSQVKVLFSLAEYVSIPTGSYIEYEGVQYTLLSPASITKAHTRSFDYVLLFEAPQSLMGLYIVRDLVDGRVNFTLTATPQEHLQLIVDNLNQRDNGWLKGSCIAAKEKTINYNKISCYDALKLIADEFESEFEVVDKRVSIGKVVYYENTPIMLSYGNGNGFVSGVTRQNFDNSKSLAAIYPEGSERNIDRSKYGSMTLLLPKSALILYDGLHFEGEVGYDGSRAIAYFTDARGLSVYRDTSIGNKAEGTLDCTEIYPSRVGKVTSVIEVSAKDNLYDVIDVAIPKALDYQACRIAGEEMIIAFQSGMLAGREFVVAEYKHAERRFILTPQTYDGETMPSAKYPIRIGDEYAVFGIALPDAYICDNASKSGASWDMLRKCVRYLYDNEQPRYSFTGDIDAIWAENNWDAVNPYFRVGASVKFMDAQIQAEPVKLRVTSVKIPLNSPYNIELSLGERAIERMSQRRMSWMQQNVANLRNNDKVAKGASQRTNKALDHLASGYGVLDSWQQGFMGGIPEDTPKGIISAFKIDTSIEIARIKTEKNYVGNRSVTSIVEFTPLTSDNQTMLKDANGKVLYVRVEATYEILRDKDGKILKDSNGRVLKARIDDEGYNDYKSYIDAADKYEEELTINLNSVGVPNTTPELETARVNYYKALDKVQNRININNDVKFLKKVFGEERVLDAYAATLSSLVAVMDEDKDIRAGLYGGDVEELDSIGLKSGEHGALMMFAGAQSLDDVGTSRFRVYEDGTVYQGVARRSKTTITPSTLYKYISFEVDEDISISSTLNLLRVGSFIELRGFNDDGLNPLGQTKIRLPYYNGEDKYPKSYNINDYLSFVGQTIVMQFSNGINIEKYCIEGGIISESTDGPSFGMVCMLPNEHTDNSIVLTCEAAIIDGAMKIGWRRNL